MKFKPALLLALLFLGCSAGIKLVESFSEAEFSESTIFHFDEKSELNWLVSHDDQQLYVRLNTAKRTTQMKILRAGLHLYFDENGEKKESTYLNFPVFQERRIMDSDEAGARSRPGRPGGRGERPKFDINKTIERTQPEAVFVKNDVKETFNYLEKDSDILIIMSGDTADVFHLMSAIPLNKIFPEGKKQSSKLSVGIVSGAFEIPVRPGGGMPGQGRNAPGGNQRMAEMQKRMAEMAEAVKIWAQIKL
jgi:hypothetical protein